MLLTPWLKDVFLLKRLTSTVAKAMRRSKIIPDVIDKGPEETADIIYPCGDKVELGNELTPKRVKDIPLVKWNACKQNFYTICMLDPDAPNPNEPILKEWNHWLVGNIPGNKIHEGETLSEYIGSCPPEGSDLHRYVFLIYKQNSKLTFNGPRLRNTSGKNRDGFSIRTFMEIYHLSSPIAGNFFLAKYDDYARILNKRISA